MQHASSPNRLILDGEALVHNWRAMARLSGSAAAGAAVKANGYGLGARDVVARLSGAGCKNFFVAHLAEAAEIADLVPPDQIAVLNGISEGDVVLARAIGVIPVLNSPAQIAMWKASGGGRCHVMLDTGINRLGVGPDQIDAALFDGLEIGILMSHLAFSDENHPENAAQLCLFENMSRGISASVSVQRRSLANSAGIMLGSGYHFDVTRPGISLYGGASRPELQQHIKTVVRMQSQILQIRYHKAGSMIGYNGTYICTNDSRVATCAIGYADGYRRAFSNAGSATFENVSLPVIGRVSMDLVTLDVTASANLQEGDWVDIDYSLIAASAQSGIPQYELLTGLGSRFDRSWQ